MLPRDEDEASELLSVSEFSQDDDRSSSHEEEGSSHDPESAKKRKKKSKAEEIGSKETKSVFRAKLMVYLVLICSCIGASVAVYFVIEDQERDDFKSDFNAFAREISTTANLELKARFESAEILSLRLTSYANSEGNGFPFVTLPDFEFRTAQIRNISESDLVMMVQLFGQELSAQWENYTQFNGGWLEEGLIAQGLEDVNPGPIPMIHDLPVNDFHVPFGNGTQGRSQRYLQDTNTVVAPAWQMGPAPFNAAIVNSNFLVDPVFERMVEAVVFDRTSMLSQFTSFPISKYFVTDQTNSSETPHSFILSPIFQDFQSGSLVVGFYYLSVRWDSFFNGIITQTAREIDVVVRDSCGGQATFVVAGSTSYFRGVGDLHDDGYNGQKVTEPLDGLRTVDAAPCQFMMDIYPTSQLERNYNSDDPLLFSITVACIFLFTTAVFLVYDWAVQRRQWMIIRAARKTQAIVSSLFPKNVQDRIMKDVDEEVHREANGPLITRGNRTKDQLQNFLKGNAANAEQEGVDEAVVGPKRSKPIADLFPEATIIFADIVGFTAWSSTREPSQVFQLLETIYHVFDEIANRRRVFKVETVGDCYVAVAGLPEPRKDHALVMARFSRDCLLQFTSTVKSMVVELGPDTEELGIRIGLHSGPVTAGVLRGERARFQLFGDTVNTTARMESTGQPNKIHVSQETADLLTAAGKSQWLRTRREKVVAKGKGELQTYWLESTGEANTVTTSGESESDEGKDEANAQAARTVTPAPAVPSADKYNRLVAWNCDILAKLLTQIVARRESRRMEPDPVAEIRKLEEQYCSNRYVLSEVQEIVRLPKFEADAQRVDPWSVQLSEDVLGQLKDYVQTLAAMYRDNPFHNFEHASHVTMSVMKLLSRIVAPDTSSDTEEALHDHTYGITSDPMTQFAVALSALIHDVDHPGVPNSQLIKEETSLAAVYRNKSIAEQNSVDLAWDLLMDDAYGDLRNTIYVTKAEFLRFRQLVVNVVLATDIMDKDLGALRKGRWNRAFSDQASGNSDDDVNRKATIVMEHLIQASDVAHTMQHWHIYRKWNQRLFREMYEAYLHGRSEKDPADFWYEGEKGFFDFYIIPLAKKLKDCGVFGVSSDEYLQYAVQNRKEWELKGQELVAEMLKTFREQGLIPGQTQATPPEPPRQASQLSLAEKEKRLV